VWHRLMFACAALVAAPPTMATTYCCTDDNGHRLCGDVLPLQCLKRPYQELGSQGTVMKQHEAPLTAEQKAQRDAEQARRRAEERKASEEDRRNRALLASYASVKDIDAKRDRAIADAEIGLRGVQDRYTAALARREELRKDSEFYVKQPMPAALKAKIAENETDIATHQTAIAARKAEITDIANRFEEEKQRYLKLSAKRQGAIVDEPTR
jgi:hypothetical protein